MILSSVPRIDLSYYTVEPEHYGEWLELKATDIDRKSGDGSTKSRKKLYAVKVEEIKGSDDE